MTRTLIIMRHAKSSWASPGLDDHERPLNDRGRASAQALGAWLKDQGITPDQTMISSARRTQETFQRLDLEAPPSRIPALYHASAPAMLREVRKATGTCVLVVGHNPGIAEFAEMIVAAAPVHPRFYDYPTGSTLVANVACAWSKLEPGNAIARDFIIPRDVMG